ncbi:aspartate-trna ligase [Colletotrichum incanum]|uniref:Aspartate-trna ligase n=1 Tax=Colletotrichum incanum TaxID=1573173 RepID=A0A162P2V9_COLIC|nr:aspartate-trna ligase [Colletotrichum incanum]
MICEDQSGNGSSFSLGKTVPSITGGNILLHSHAYGHHKVFDARVQSRTGTHFDSTVTILLRRQGTFIKAILDSSSTSIESLKAAQALKPESLVRLSGSFHTAHQSGQIQVAPEVAIFKVTNLVVLSTAKVALSEGTNLHGAPDETAPLREPRFAMIETRLDNRLLDGRVASTSAIFKIFSGVHELAVEFLSARDFYHVPTPSLVSYGYPGEDDDFFSVPYFDRTTRLAPTGEVHLGMALSADMERVYDFHSVFRREPHSDGRHLTEFTMLELVFNLQNDWTEILELAGNLLVSLIRSLQEREKYKMLIQSAKRLYPSADSFKLGLTDDGKLIRVTFSEAKLIIRDLLGLQSHDEDDFTRGEEAALGRFIASEESHLGPPTDVFVITHFPRHLRACNLYPSENGDNTTQSFDVILRGQEIVTGCRLLHSHEDLLSAFETRSPPIDTTSPEWRPFLTAHEIVGINRFVQGFMGLADIRETVLFPRDAARLEP